MMFLCFCFKQKTAYEMRISDWSSDVCSSDLRPLRLVIDVERFEQGGLIHHRLAADASTGASETVAIENIQIAVLLIPGFQILGADQIARIMVQRRSVAAIKTCLHPVQRKH